VRSSGEDSSVVERVDPAVVRAVHYVAKYMGSHDDWVDIKIEIMNNLRPELRRLFSRRDQQTREQVPNEFDRAVMREYSLVSGVTPVVRTLAERRALRSGIDSE
jgi:hypothetical protein